MGRKHRDSCIYELFDVNIFIQDLLTDLSPRYIFEQPSVTDFLRLIYKNNDHYDLFVKKNIKSKGISFSKENKSEFLVRPENSRKQINDDYINKEEITTSHKKYKES